MHEKWNESKNSHNDNISASKASSSASTLVQQSNRDATHLFSVVCRDVSLKLFQLLHLPVRLHRQWLWFYEEVGSFRLLGKTLHQPKSFCAILSLSEFETEEILISAVPLIFSY